MLPGHLAHIGAVPVDVVDLEVVLPEITGVRVIDNEPVLLLPEHTVEVPQLKNSVEKYDHLRFVLSLGHQL